jgi:beta-lactam-binding protein with PASTA domain
MIAWKDFFTFRRNRSFWLQIIAMVALLFVLPTLVLCALDVYTHHGDSVTVPNVKGQMWREAVIQIEQADLRATVIDSSYVKGMPTGCILEQNPAGGAKVKDGRTVYLTLNARTVPTLPMPDLMDNSSLRQAEAKLRAMGFRLTDPQYVSGERDWVYGVKYNGREVRAGEKIPHEALLTLCVGNGGMVIASDSLGLEEEGIGLEESTDGSASAGSASTGSTSGASAGSKKHEDKAEVDESWF